MLQKSQNAINADPTTSQCWLIRGRHPNVHESEYAKEVREQDHSWNRNFRVFETSTEQFEFTSYILIDNYSWLRENY